MLQSMIDIAGLSFLIGIAGDVLHTQLFSKSS